jgi:hypothetical protein
MDIMTTLEHHPIAVRVFASIEPEANLPALVDLHRRLVAHSSYQSHAAALGIEMHVRETVARYCHITAARKELERLDDTLEGTGVRRRHLKALASKKQASGF